MTKPSDPIEAMLTSIRFELKAGVDRFSLPAAVVMDLIDQADHLEDLYRFKVVYGAAGVLNHLQDRGSQERFLLDVLQARRNSHGHYEILVDDYIGVLWDDEGPWSWFTKTLDGRLHDNQKC